MTHTVEDDFAGNSLYQHEAGPQLSDMMGNDQLKLLFQGAQVLRYRSLLRFVFQEAAALIYNQVNRHQP